MKILRFFPFASFLFCLIFQCYSQTVSGDSRSFRFPEGVDFIPGRIVLKVKPEYRGSCLDNRIALQALESTFQTISASSITKKFPRHLPPKPKEADRYGNPLVDLSLVYQLTIPGSEDMESAINQLRWTGVLEYAEPVYIRKANFIPTDPDTAGDKNYHLRRIKAYEAWDLEKGDTSVVVGVVDTGVEWTRADLAGNIAHNYADPIDGLDNDNDGFTDNFTGWDFNGPTLNYSYPGDNDPNISDADGSHGTHVAGLAGATTNNGIGIAGVGFNCRILPVKCSSDDGGYYVYSAFDGIAYAADHGADIINCSWGGEGFSHWEQDVVNYAVINKGCVVVAAAGNSGLTSNFFFPACYENVFAVAATTKTDGRSNFTNYFYKVDISAPGSGIYSFVYPNAYASWDGTSMAAPIVSGAAALLRAHFPAESPQQIMQRLRVTADDIYANNQSALGRLGKGRLNILKALTLSLPGIKQNSLTITDGNDGHFQPGDTLRISGQFINMLASSSANLKVVLSYSGTAITVLPGSAEVTLGVVPTGQTKNTAATPFLVVIGPTATSDALLDLRLSYSDGADYADFEYFGLPINASYLHIEKNNISTTVTSKGKMGWNDNGSTIGLGFQYKGMQKAFEMGLMGGTGATKMASCVRGQSAGSVSNHFKPLSTVAQVVADPGNHLFVWETLMDDSQAGTAASGVQIRQRTYAYTSPGDSNYVLVEYRVANTNATPLTNYHLGLFSDFDLSLVGEFDHCRYRPDRKLGYVKSEFSWGNFGGYAGIALLGNTPGVHFTAIDNNGQGGSPFSVATSFTNANKYKSISSGILDSVAGTSVANGKNVSMTIGSGPYTIAPGDSIQVVFMIGAGPDLQTLLQAVDSATAKYETIKIITGAKEQQAGNESIRLVPNPGNGHFQLQGPAENILGLEVLNTIGQRVPFEYSREASNQLTINASPGMYVVKINLKGKTISSKIIVQ